MSDRLKDLEPACEHIDPRWDAAQAGRVLHRVHERLDAQKRRRRVGLGLAAAAAVALAVGGGVHVGRRSAADGRALAQASSSGTVTAPEQPVLRYHDGSSATPTAQGTEVRVDEATPTRMVTVLERGAARFDVRPDRDREFRVVVETVTVTVLGTVFAVERGAESVHVAVERGKVRVDSPAGTALLEAGQAGDYRFGPSTAAPAPSASAADAPRPQAPESWRALAKRGQHKEAYELMRDLRPGQVRDAEELLAAADVARLAGHPGEAAPFLERVLTDFRGDPRAPVAAFGLGRILMAGRPAAAAARFAEARALAPGGTLAQDALAREVEAWSRAGAQARAREAAEEYVRRYPKGARTDQVRKMGGL